MNDSTIHQNIIQMEEKYWTAMANKDVESAVALTRFPCVITGPQGSRKVSEEEYRKLMKAIPEDAFKDIKMENPEVEQLNADTAVITYSTHVNGMKMQDVSTWIHEDGKWTCAFHAENPLH